MQKKRVFKKQQPDNDGLPENDAGDIAQMRETVDISNTITDIDNILAKKHSKKKETISWGDCCWEH